MTAPPYHPPMPHSDRVPGYVQLARSGELARRADAALAKLGNCRLCSRLCGTDRLTASTGVCRTGRQAVVAHSGLDHNGGVLLHGCGTLWFAGCSLHCACCPHPEISHEGQGDPLTANELADLMLEHQRRGARALRLVMPTHVVAQVLEALVIAAGAGLTLPLIYDTAGFETIHTLRLLRGVVDVYHVDFKLWDPVRARLILSARQYPSAARTALREMVRQVGTLIVDDDGAALRGVMVHHMVLPGGVDGAVELLSFIASDLSPDTPVILDGGYIPVHRIPNEDRFAAFNRPNSRDEVHAVLDAARQLGLSRVLVG